LVHAFDKKASSLEQGEESAVAVILEVEKGRIHFLHDEVAS